MGTIWVRQFTGGLDTRRLPETTPGGVLVKANNGHITSGGEFEKRAAFVEAYSLPAGTFGIYHQSTGIVVFGSASAPTMPSGVIYQQLVHPDGSTAMQGLLSASLFSGKIYAVAQFVDGSIEHYYDGARVTDWFDGRARANFRVTGGVSGDTLADLKVDGVSILTGPISWTTSNVNTAGLIAAAINSLTSSPDYSAVAVGDQVDIVATTAGAASNGFGVEPTLTGTLTVSPATGIVLANGSDDTTTYTPGPFVVTLGSKVYALAGPELHFSGIAAPTKWTTDVTGAGLIDMSQYDSEAMALTAVANYQTFIAVFAGRVIIIEYVDPDPSLNRKSQVLKNTGTESPRSVTEFGDNDVFYLDESGCRSLRARDASNAATTTDVGTPIDNTITLKLQGFSDSDRAKIIGLVNPVDGRFWLIMGDEIMVFSFFANAKVSAWSQYLTTCTAAGVTTSFSVDDATVWNRRVYLRSGDTIYAYSGLDAVPVYDETVAEAWLPYLDADQPTMPKQWAGIDAAVKGTWSVGVGMEPTDLSVEDLVSTIAMTTYNGGRIAFDGESTHASLRFRSQGTGPAVLSAAALHYEGDLSEAE